MVHQYTTNRHRKDSWSGQDPHTHTHAHRHTDARTCKQILSHARTQPHTHIHPHMHTLTCRHAGPKNRHKYTDRGM